MTYEQFWTSDLSAYYTYLIAYNNLENKRLKRADEVAWKIGEYVLRGINSTIQIVNLASEGTINKLPKYPTKPDGIRIVNKSEEENKPKDRKINKTPPTEKEIAEYNKKMELLTRRQ